MTQTYTFGASGPILTGNKAFTGTDADMQNILNWAKVAYAAVIDELFNPTHTPGFNPTNQQPAPPSPPICARDDASRKFKKDSDLAAVPHHRRKLARSN
jgi:hypothetical protein